MPAAGSVVSPGTAYGAVDTARRAAALVLLYMLLLSVYVQALPAGVSSAEDVSRRAPYLSSIRHSKATVCRFMGAVADPQNVTEEVVLSVFIRAIAVSNQRLLVRAFSFMQPTKHPARGGMQQELQAEVEKHYNGSVFLKSLASKREFHLRKFPAQKPAEVTVWITDEPLNAVDDDMGELTLRAEGFLHLCLVPLERMSAERPGLDLASTCDPACLQPGAAKPLGPDILRGRDGAVWVLSPMHSMSARHIAMLLAYHWAWHSQLGVVKYLLYVLYPVSRLTRIPHIQAMVAAGRLDIVVWDSLPAHVHGIWNYWPDGYTHQFLVLNAALLEHWTQDVHLVMLDIDEWIMTPKPMNVSEIFQACTPKGYIAGFSPYIKPVRCQLCSKGGKVAELWHWKDLLGGGPALELAEPGAHTDPAVSREFSAGVNADLNANNGSLPTGPNMYPLTLYELAGSINYSDWMPRKAILDPNLVLATALHDHFAVPCASFHVHDSDECDVMWAHMITLYGPRSRMYNSEVGPYFDRVENSSRWWWPALPRVPIWANRNG